MLPDQVSLTSSGGGSDVGGHSVGVPFYAHDGFSEMKRGLQHMVGLQTTSSSSCTRIRNHNGTTSAAGITMLGT